jgi:hypothetical protein
MKRFRQLCVLVCTAILFVTATGSTAYGVVPGENGRILFTRCVWKGDCTWEIVAADPDGSDEVVLAGPYPREAWDDHFIANWSPDGETAIFMAYQAIWQVNADGTHLHKIWNRPRSAPASTTGRASRPTGSTSCSRAAARGFPVTPCG